MDVVVSLLDTGNTDILVYLEVKSTDSDGNIITKASDIGIPARALVQVLAQSGTSARRSEQDNEGFETELLYRLRFPRNFPHVLGAQARIEWEGAWWAIQGDPRLYNGSRRTRHLDYTIRRT
jgi:hypothetical protein